MLVFWVGTGFTNDAKDQILRSWMKNITEKSPTLLHSTLSFRGVGTLGVGPPLIPSNRVMAPSVPVLQNSFWIWSWWRVFWRPCYVWSVWYSWHMLIITLLTGFLPLQFLFLFVSSADLRGSSNFVCNIFHKPGQNWQHVPDVNQGTMFYVCS